MANPAKKLESLLRLHRFELVSQKKHLKYKNPQGKIYVMGKTPSDFRAAHKALTVLERVIVNPVPTSEVIEEERQRRELEATITLQAQPKPSISGIAGAGKGKKSKGCGIYYEEKLQPTAEELVLREEQRENALANRERKEAEKRERRAARRESEEWSRQLSSFRKQSQRLTRDMDAVAELVGIAATLHRARTNAAVALWKDRRGAKAHGYNREKSAMFVDASFAVTLRHVARDGDAEERESFNDMVHRMAGIAAGYLLHAGGRAPKFLLITPGGATFPMTAPKLAPLRRALAFLRGGRLLEAEETLGLPPTPEWLRQVVLRLRPGDNPLLAMECGACGLARAIPTIPIDGVMATFSETCPECAEAEADKIMEEEEKSA
jgi:hypothetical protein